jgi:hypothetical protein
MAGDAPTIAVEVRATNLASGLRDISQFAGYCERTLLLEHTSSTESEWAAVLASYFGFGFALSHEGERIDVMPSPIIGTSQAGPRGAFIRRVLVAMEQS